MIKIKIILVNIPDVLPYLTEGWRRIAELIPLVSPGPCKLVSHTFTRIISSRGGQDI